MASNYTLSSMNWVKFWTLGNVDDRKPVPKMVKALFGKLFGDKGYLSNALFESLLE
jgi:hypothetical protein